MARLDRELRRGERVLERAEDLRGLLTPFRVLGQALLDRRSLRRRERRRERFEGEEEDPSAAI